MKYFLPLLTLAALFLAASCGRPQPAETADLILINGNIYTVDSLQMSAQAIAVKGERILKVGSNEDIQQLKGDSTQVIDLEGKFLMPGFIEGHGHYAGLGSSLMNLNFLKSKSWDDIVKLVEQRAKSARRGDWIVGRGWHQEKWTKPIEKAVLGYPYHDSLSAISPDNPVILSHASGHSLFANAKAMELAGITADTPNPPGGEIVRDARGTAIGVFEERAMSLITKAYDAYLASLSSEQKKEQWLKGIELAEQECLSKGITSFQDAGSSFQEMEWYRELAEAGRMKVRLWAMVRHPYHTLKGKIDAYPVIDAGNGYFTCRAIKSELDGALGAYGAWLLAPYDDKPGFSGQNTTPIEEVRRIAGLALERNMQLCVHTIGDKANRELLNLCEELFRSQPNAKDLRWRSEHAQHIDPVDIPRFPQIGIIAAMQGIHCTSDAPFVVKRLGEERARTGAYPWRSLLDAGAVVTNGTDAPVEDVSALESFYASVTRKRADTGMAFFPEQRMTRAEGVYSYTLANAYAAFEEKNKGSIEAGKLADFVVLSNDLLNCPDEDILSTRVLMTIVGGKVKFKAE
ncbi:MAG TPA: amidohydrolase [Saprospiraceae bacterium]|nr:amidohydrolase [Saprospiraceae bacterium]